MKDDPESFFLQSFTDSQSVVFYPVNTYIDFSFNRGAFQRKFERDNVGIEIMVQVLAIDLQQLFIRTKNIIKTLEFFFLPFKQDFQKSL